MLLHYVPNKPSPLQYFSVNRFFYDCLMSTEHPTLSYVSEKLMLPESEISSTIRCHCKHWFGKNFSVTVLELKHIASTLNNAEFDEPPLIYRLIHNSIRNNTLYTLQHAELILKAFKPVRRFHFDFKELIFSRIVPQIPKSLWCKMDLFMSSTFSDNVLAKANFKKYEYLQQCFNHLPNCIKNLTGDERFLLNNELSVAHLYGVVTIPSAGISSPHLNGVFNLTSRKPNTGYLSLDSLLNKKNQIPTDKLNEILAWLKENNVLYQNFEPLTIENYNFRIDPTRAPSGNAINTVIIPNGNKATTDRNGNVYIRLKKNNDQTEGKFIPLEEALALSFPMLFPFGVLEKIPGKTLREKARAILGSHPYYRCGRLQCHLILFLYHLIMDHDTSFYFNKISMQNVYVPEGTSRNIPPQSHRSDDPAFSTYWSRRQAEVRTMCSQFGDPDLMLTFTFVNKWPEVEKIENDINSLSFDKIDIRFCPLEEMYIWDQRFKDIMSCRFSQLTNSLGFGMAAHYTWRLEFQARGAPHVHALIWLHNRLSIENISNLIYAEMPDPSTPQLLSLVNGPMIHACNINRCKKGIPTARCKYGFPKPECGRTHISEDGELIIRRSSSDSNIVEYHPFMLLKWGGHCHMHILRTVEHPECSPNAIFYIVKYNFKTEPSLKIEMRDNGNNNFRTAFHGRVVSAEEAISKIFSFDYYGSDISSEYLSLRMPETRKAAFINGNQIQITNIEKYFARPLELEKMGILTFFSLYNITASNVTNAQRINELNNKLSGDKLRTALEIPKREREPNTLKTNWESENLRHLVVVRKEWLFPSQNLPNAKALQCIRRKPKIIITEKFSYTSNIEEFAYVYLLLNGAWRSDEEMKAGKNSWMEALEYHGLCLPDDDEIMKFNRLLIKYMLNSSRYNDADISRTISTMNENMVDYLISLKSEVSLEQKRTLDNVIEILNCRDQIINNTIVSLEQEPAPEVINKYICYSFDSTIKNSSIDELPTIIDAFNIDQSHVFNEIKNRIDGGIQIKAFISGKAGTGKTYLINAIKKLLIANEIPFIVCASTGIAASIIGGRTVHSAFRIFAASYENKEDVYCSLDISRENGYAISYTKLIIIDEVTMMPGNVLYAINDGLKKLSAQKNDQNYALSFGGRSILLFGDLAQVPAVTKTYDDYSESIEQFYKSKIFEEFTRFDLNIVMRQNPEEHEFIKLLEYVRNSIGGRISDPSINDLLRQRFIPGTLDNVINIIDDFVGGDSTDGMVITFTNRTANEYNHSILLKRLNGDQSKILRIHAKFFIEQKCSYLPQNEVINVENELQAQRDTARIHQASNHEISIFCGAMKKRLINSIIPFELHIAPNCRIMLLQNLDLSRGLINGTRGTLIDYIQEIDALSIHFDVQQDDEPPVLLTRKKSVKYQIHDGKTIFMYQFPVKLAWAVTAHKSQGQTLNRAAINISEVAFAHGSFYVALSRVKSLNNLKLFGLDQWPENGPDFHINPYIQYEQNAHAENDF